MAVVVNPISPQPFGAFGSSVAVSVKPTSGNLASLYGSNGNQLTRYLQIFNKATAPVTNDVPVFSFVLTGSGGSVIIGTDFFTTSGELFSTGIAVGVSTTNGTFTAATASEHNINGTFY